MMLDPGTVAELQREITRAAAEWNESKVVYGDNYDTGTLEGYVDGLRWALRLIQARYV